MRQLFTLPVLIVCFFFITGSLLSQENASDTAYVFEVITDIDVTPVRDQSRSGTCWAFAGISFVEAEILRETGKELDLSEMFIVRYAYPGKALKYIRLHGNSVFGPGGQAHDVLNVIDEYGMVPEEVYNGMNLNEEEHNHAEMDAVLKGIVDAVSKRRGGKITPVWMEAFNAVLDVYLGKAPESFLYNEKEYSSSSFAEMTGFDPDGYIEITSYLGHPFYKPFILQVPDNWSNDLYYNVPLDDLMAIMDHSLEKGYTVCWDGDVSDRGFSHKNGLAILPEKRVEELGQTEQERWEGLTEAEKNDELYSFEKPVSEKIVDQDVRQEAYENQTATDDHLMHITGSLRDQNGTIYYQTKNSWNDDSNEYGGYLKMSESYVRMKTIAIMVNKEAIPKDIARKLGL